jgi:osmoprotectant transport system permease protein
MRGAARRRDIAGLGAVAVVLLVAVLMMPATAPFFAWAFPGVTPPVYTRDSFLSLLLSHAGLVAASSAAAAIVGVGLGIFVTGPAGRDARAIVDTIATIGQTMPPAAVLALAVPVVGYGAEPTIIALAIYGLLPIVANTIAGLEGIPPSLAEAARGMGLSPAQRLVQVELPLAAPVIVAGIRTSVIINIGTATLGSTIGAVTLGSPIIDGLVSNKLPYVIQGAIIVGLFAILVDRAAAKE